MWSVEMKYSLYLRQGGTGDWKSLWGRSDESTGLRQVVIILLRQWRAGRGWWHQSSKLFVDYLHLTEYENAWATSKHEKPWEMLLVSYGWKQNGERSGQRKEWIVQMGQNAKCFKSPVRVFSLSWTLGKLFNGETWKGSQERR